MKPEQSFDLTPHIEPTNRVVRGVPLEVTGFDNKVYPWLMRAADRIWAARAQIHVEGDLPHKDGAIFIATHTRNESTVLLPWLTTKILKRPIQVLAKDTLLKTQLRDRDNVLIRTDKPPGSRSSRSERLFSGPARAANSIPIDRGGINREVFDGISQILQEGHLVGTFLQETRSDEDDLRKPFPGAYSMMMPNPEIPTYLVAMSNTRIRGSNNRPSRSPVIRISEPFTYNELLKSGVRGHRAITGELTRRMADLLLKDIPSVRLPEEKVVYQAGEVDAASGEGTGVPGA